jgi:hypothetical protein
VSDEFSTILARLIEEINRLTKRVEELELRNQELEARNQELEAENKHLFSQQVSTVGAKERKALVVTDHPQLTISRPYKLLKVACSSFYYQAQGPSDEELGLLRLIDEQYLKTPFYGSRRMTVVLR